MKNERFRQTQNEIKEAYKIVPSKAKIHGEEVVSFRAFIQTTHSDSYYYFDAPQCSTNSELESYASMQNPALMNIIQRVDFYNISFRTV